MLNEQQRKAVAKKNGPVLVLAGAGAGKTKTLTERIVSLIENGVAPQNILAITFTNKASKEMKERILKAIKENPKLNFPILDRGFEPTISTFHSLGVKILKENSQKLGLTKYFSIYDRDDTKKVLKEIVKELNLDSQEWGPKKIISFISKQKSNFLNYKNFSKTVDESNFFLVTMSKIWEKYEIKKQNDKALDFDDLILETALLLENDKNVREFYWKKWQYIHIDEYQDTNKVQNKIAELLTNPETKNIFAVGDEDQCIYSWREADLNNILNFEKKFNTCEKILLEQNYRSTKNIIEASNAVIAKNEQRFGKKLFTENEAGEKIIIYSAFTEREEAEFVAEKAEELSKKGQELDEIAVLYRANFQSRILEEAFLKKGIPYQVLGTKFFDRSEIKDLVAYLRLLLNPESQIDLKRVINSPKRGIGKASLVKIFSGDTESLSPKAKNGYQEFRDLLDYLNHKKDELKASELVLKLIEKLGYEKQAQEKLEGDLVERLENMYELVEFAKKYDNLEDSLEKMIEDISLMSDQDTDEKKKNEPKVRLMTIHASKGLEFETVFLVGAEEALFSPQEIGLDKKEFDTKKEEERRLFYVAMTRAKKRLFISWTATRMVYGDSRQNFISSFVEDIPEHLVEHQGSFREDNNVDDVDMWDLWDEF